jgi:hypothetical protein
MMALIYAPNPVKSQRDVLYWYMMTETTEMQNREPRYFFRMMEFIEAANTMDAKLTVMENWQ